MYQDLMRLDDDPKVRVKAILGSLDKRKSPDEMEGPLRELLENIDPFELDRAEEELIDDGVTLDDIKHICDAHSRAITEVTEAQENFLELPGHPIYTLMEEHLNILRFVEGLRASARAIREDDGDMGDNTTLSEFGPFMKESQKHFQREEDVLFPLLERHRMMRAPAALWSEHDVLRSKEKEISQLIAKRGSMRSEDFAPAFECRVAQLLSLLNAHFYKENHELFPMAIKSLDAHEWNDAKKQFDEIGCGGPVPRHGTVGFTSAEVPTSQIVEEISMPTGNLTSEELEMIMDRLPVDLTYVDKDDKVRFFTTSPDRIFGRTPAVIGRKVQDCHPQKSVHVVQQILDDFKAGKRDQAEFWIDMGGKTVYIRYLALKDKQGKYQGVLEVTQDITRPRELQGERRLLGEK
jgi:DUF438 domain-containing protein